MLSHTLVAPLIGSRSRKLLNVTWEDFPGVVESISRKDLERAHSFLLANSSPVKDELEPIRKSDAQGALQDALSALAKADPKLLTHAKLADFFPEDAPSAPFERELTFKQFLSLGAENIIRKRGVSAEKLEAFTSAIRNFLSANQRNTQQNTKSSSEIKFGGEESLSPMESLIISGLKSETSGGLPKDILRESAEILSANELSALIVGKESKVASKKLLLLLETKFSPLVSALSSLFTGPGAPIEVAFPVWTLNPKSGDVILLKVILYTIGITNPVLFGTTLENLYTSNPELGESIVKKLSQKDLVGEIHSLLPHFPLELIARGR
jgi:hypothetical protein